MTDYVLNHFGNVTCSSFETLEAVYPEDWCRCSGYFTSVGQGYLDYNTFYYCADVPLGHLLILWVWCLFLFNLLASTASEYIVPTIAQLAEVFRLSSDVAGVTLLAFAHSAPSLFTNFAALLGKTQNADLGIGNILGGGIFVNCLCFGTFAIIKPFPVPPVSFMRDILFYAGTLAIFYLILSQPLRLWHSFILISIFALYVLCVVNWPRIRRLCRAKNGAFAQKSDTNLGMLHDPYAVPVNTNATPTQSEKKIVHEGFSFGESSGALREFSSLEGKLAGLPGFDDELLLQPSIFVDEDSLAESKVDGSYANAMVMLSVHRPGGARRLCFNRQSRICPGLAESNSNFRAASVSLRTIMGEIEENQDLAFEQLAEDSSRELGASISGLNRSHLKRRAARSTGCAGCLDDLINLLQWDDCNWLGQVVGVLELPLTLARRATIPLLNAGSWSLAGAVCSLCVLPSFLAIVLGTSWSWGLFGPLFGVSLCFACIAWAALTASPPASPAARAFLAGWGLVGSCVWSFLIANEAIQVLLLLSAVSGISPSLLGLTFSAVCNSLGDLITGISLCQTHPSMAAAGCFGAPMFSLTVGAGSALFVRAVEATGSELVVGDLDLVQRSAFVFSLGALAFALVFLPLGAFRLRAWHGFGLVAFYLAFLVHPARFRYMSIVQLYGNKQDVLKEWH